MANKKEDQVTNDALGMLNAGTISTTQNDPRQVGGQLSNGFEFDPRQVGGVTENAVPMPQTNLPQGYDPRQVGGQLSQSFEIEPNQIGNVINPFEGAGGSAPNPQYRGTYQNVIQTMLEKIGNRDPFSYDFNADPLYQNYKDQYVKLGNEAAMNAAANASALTGGYGSSYATTAASQANQQYLTQLNNIIPELQQAALQQYQMEGDDMYKALAMYQQADDTEYGRYRDDVGDQQWREQFDYQKDRDKVADKQWQDQFDYQKSRDEIADQKWREEFDTAYQQWLKEFNYKMDRDKVSDEQWLKEFQSSYEKWLKEFEYKQQRDKISDEQWERQFQLSKSKTTPSKTNTTTTDGDTTTTVAPVNKNVSKYVTNDLVEAYRNYSRNTNTGMDNDYLMGNGTKKDQLGNVSDHNFIANLVEKKYPKLSGEIQADIVYYIEHMTD